ncbi:MAG: hypothetical protein M1526_01925 [Candidatus Thermoplasmatota archaeon]|jgi:hypothetical protein|nr:hypothetical protein [Candidatus Thermoplasmatota archaeon]
MANLLDEALKEIYKETMGRDPLAFMKDAIDWNAFPPLLKDIYQRVQSNRAILHLDSLLIPLRSPLSFESWS